jgi:hypothetical protein
MSLDTQLNTSTEISTDLDKLSHSLYTYLRYLGLPVESVLVDIGERRNVINNMPSVVSKLSGDQRQSAMYISKFAAACIVGLFDAALNYLWDETIQNLCQKVIRFDIDYFYDTAVTDSKQRSNFKDESDLIKLDDWVIVKGCRDTGIVSDIGYKHLDYIRDMRNHASAAHPNHNELTGLQLASWLETCIKEVFSKEPAEPAIQAKRLLHSLRNETLSKNDIPPINSAVLRLPEDIAHSLLRSIFGMYTDPKLDAKVRNNISLVTLQFWRVCSEEAKYDIGIKQASFSANGEVSRANLARNFLEIVNGLAYLSPGEQALEITAALDLLRITHNGWNNFHNELAPAKILQSFIPLSGNIPGSVAQKYVKILTMCKIGNGYGVSQSAEPIYDNLIARWQDPQISSFIHLILDPEVRSRLQFDLCNRSYQTLAKSFHENATNPNTKEALEFIMNVSAHTLHKIGNDSRFKTILSTLKK